MAVYSPWSHRESDTTEQLAHFHFALCYNIVSFLLQSLVWNSCCGQFLKRWEYQTTLPASWEICMQVKKQQLEPDMKQQTGSKSGKEYVKAVYCHPAYLTYMQSTWCEMLGWLKHKLE